MPQKRTAKRLAFFATANGRFALDAQEAFESAQRIAAERGKPVTVAMGLTVMPPDEDKIGSVSYQVAVKVPAKKSREFTTEYRDGFIVNDADNQVELIQESLDLNLPSSRQLRLDEATGA